MVEEIDPVGFYKKLEEDDQSKQELSKFYEPARL